MGYEFPVNELSSIPVVDSIYFLIPNREKSYLPKSNSLKPFSDPDIVKYGIPHLMHYGDFTGYKVIVMTKTGLSLNHLRKKVPNRKFGLKAICKIAMQAVTCQMIHSLNIEYAISDNGFI